MLKGFGDCPRYRHTWGRRQDRDRAGPPLARSFLILAPLMLGPYLTALSSRSLELDPFTGFLRAIGFAVCHQLPERTLVAAGSLLPVCARDTGIYLGFLVGLVLIAALEGEHPREMPSWPILVLCVGFVGVMGWDGVTSYAGLRQTTNDIRLITGLLAGFAMPPVVLGMLNYQLWGESAPGRVLGPQSHSLAWIGAIPITYLAVRYAPLGIDMLLAPLIALAIIVAFTSVNLVMVTLAPPFERKARDLKGFLVPTAIAFALSAAELALAGWLHATAVRALIGRL